MDPTTHNLHFSVFKLMEYSKSKKVPSHGLNAMSYVYPQVYYQNTANIYIQNMYYI